MVTSMDISIGWPWLRWRWDLLLTSPCGSCVPPCVDPIASSVRAHDVKGRSLASWLAEQDANLLWGSQNH